MLLTAVFLLSFSALAFEVLLARVFSITQWNHLAFMVIGIALFGFAAAGTFLSVLGVRRAGWEQRLSRTGPLSVVVLLFSATALLGFLVLNRLPLDYFRLPLEPLQTLYLLAAYLLLALPFFFSGLAVSLAYAAEPEKTGRIYLATMAGGAGGALFPALLLPLLGESRLVAVVALIPLLGLLRTAARPRSSARPALLAAAALLVSAFACAAGGALALRPSAYKDLSQLLMFPDTRVVASATGIRGRLDRVQSPYIRFAPGQSLTFTGTLPRQEALFTDGEQQMVLYGAHDPAGLGFCRFSLPYAGYVLPGPVDPVLVIAENGGSAVACALAAGARDVTVAATDPLRAQAIASWYRLPAVDQPPRAFLARSARKFAVIQLDDWGPPIAGTAALNQGYLLTVDAFAAYLEHLLPHGKVIVARRLLLPPTDAIRLWASAREALERRGVPDPSRHLAVIRNFDSFTLVLSARPLSQKSALSGFVRRMNFDWVFAPGIGRGDANRFNRFDAPYHFDALAAAEAAYRQGRPQSFYDAYPLDVAPQTDLRPYPHRFLKWSGTAEVYRSTGRRLYTLLLSGEVVVAVLLLESLAVAALLLIPAMWAVRGHAERTAAAQVVYFGGLGAGFMFVELYYIKAFTLIFGNPVVSLTAVLACLLVASGIGGLCSEVLGRRWLPRALGLLTAWLVMCGFASGPLLQRVLGLPAGLRYGAAALMSMPAGVLMGIVFALGMRDLPRRPAQRVAAWTANGCTSVVSAVAAAQVALSLGIPAVLGLGIAGYLAAGLAVRGSVE